MQVVNLLIQQLVAADWNPNQMDAAKFAKLKRSLAYFGLVSILVVRSIANGFYEVLSGNQRLQALQELDFTSVPCMVVDLDDARARLLAQTLNRLQGEDDLGLKAELLREGWPNYRRQRPWRCCPRQHRGFQNWPRWARRIWPPNSRCGSGRKALGSSTCSSS